MPAAELQKGEIQSPRRGVRSMFRDLGLDSEKTLWDFSFSSLIEYSLKSVIYVAPRRDAKLITSHFQDGGFGTA